MSPLLATWTTDINTESGSGRTMDPDIILGSIPGLDYSACHPHHRGPCSSVVLIHQYGPREHPRPLASAQFLMVSGATDIITDHGCRRTTDPDMALGHSFGLDNTMIPVDSHSHPNWVGSNIGTVLDTYYRPDPQSSTWVLPAAWASKINTDSGKGRTTDTNMVLGSSLGQLVAIALDACAGHLYWHGPHGSKERHMDCPEKGK